MKRAVESIGIFGLSVIILTMVISCGSDEKTRGDRGFASNMVYLPKSMTGYMFNYFIDKYEAGCKATVFSTADSDDSSGCTGEDGTVCYRRGTIYNSHNGKCYLKKDGTWLEADDLSGADLASVYTNEKGYPPLVHMTHDKVLELCENVQASLEVNGEKISTTKILPSQMMWFIASSWYSDWRAPGDAAQAAIEGTSAKDADLPDGSFPCNTYGREDGRNEGTGLGSFLTGSGVTAQCTSFFGARDMVGNVHERINESLTSTSDFCPSTQTMYYCVSGDDNGIDSLWEDFGQWDVVPHAPNWGYVMDWYFDQGIPKGQLGGDGSALFNGDIVSFHILDPNTLYYATSSGSWREGAEAGRFRMYVGTSPTWKSNNIGFRCAAIAE